MVLEVGVEVGEGSRGYYAVEGGIGEVGDGKHVDEDGDKIGVILAQGGGEVIE